MPIRKQSRKLSGGRRRSGRKLSGGRKVRVGPRGGKYVLRAGQKVYLSGGLACARRREKKDPKCEEQAGCKWEERSGEKKGRCFDPTKQKKPAAAKKKKPAAAESKKSKKQAINDTKLMNELAIYNDRGNFIGEEDDDGNWSNEAYFRDLFKSTRLDLSMTHGTLQNRNSGVQITSDDGLAIARDRDYDGHIWPAKTLAFIFNNLKHFKRLKELTLDNGRDYDQRWINNTQSHDFMYVTGKRPSKLKKLVISGFKDVPSPFTNGLDELLIRTNIEKVPMWERDQLFTNVHENIRKVVFDGFNKQSYDTDGSMNRRGITRTSKQRHDENIAYLKRIFPDSEIVFRGDDDTEYQLDELQYLPYMIDDGTFTYYPRDNLPGTGRRGPREPWNA